MDPGQDHLPNAGLTCSGFRCQLIPALLGCRSDVVKESRSFQIPDSHSRDLAGREVDDAEIELAAFVALPQRMLGLLPIRLKILLAERDFVLGPQFSQRCGLPVERLPAIKPDGIKA